MRVKLNLQVNEKDYDIFKKIQTEYKEKGIGTAFIFSEMMTAYLEKRGEIMEKSDGNKTM